VALIAASHGLIVGVHGLFGPATYTIFIAAIVLCAYFWGYGPSLVATGLASLDLVYTFLRPYHTFELESENVMFLLAFLAVALVTSTLQARRRWAEEQLRRAHDELEQRVRERTEELARSHRDILEIAEREQQRIGRDLHDGLGQELTGIAMLSTALAEQVDGSPLAADAEQVAELVHETIRHTRELARGLCPVNLEDDGLAVALELLCGRIGRLPEMECRFEQVGDSDLPLGEAVATHLYRIAQEAVSNAIRHGRARSIEVRLENAGPALTLTIRDDGVGFSPAAASSGMGLRLMHYRAKMCRGSLSVSSAPGGGTVVECVLGTNGVLTS